MNQNPTDLSEEITIDQAAKRLSEKYLKETGLTLDINFLGFSLSVGTGRGELAFRSTLESHIETREDGMTITKKSGDIFVIWGEVLNWWNLSQHKECYINKRDKKPIDTRKKNSYLGVIAGLLYMNNIKALKFGLPKTIMLTLEQKGINLSDDAISTVMKEVEAYLSSK